MRNFLLMSTAIPFRLGRARPEPVEPDPADVGTAFGLDLSMAPLEPVVEVEPLAPAASGPPVAWGL